MSVVTIDYVDEIGVVTVENPPINALSQAVRQGLWNAVAELDANETLKAVVLICAGRTFIAGADVKEFSEPPVEPHLPDLVNRIESAKTPWIAAVHGSALGGGLEIALGCRFRVGSPEAFLGLPEVTLGIVPGATGTVRTPRLVGMAEAVELVCSGKPIKASRARQIGLIDAVIVGNLRENAIAFARMAIAKPLPLPSSMRPLNNPQPTFWAEAEASIARRSRGEHAPSKALECLKAAATESFFRAAAFERSTFLALRNSEQSAALRSVFFAERAAARPSYLKDVRPRPIRKVGVVGGGTMGAGIAAAMRDAGLPVTLVERDEDALARGLSNVRAIYAGAVKRGRMSEAEAAERSEVAGTIDYAALSDADLVIEAVFEQIELKRAVFARLAACCRPDAILATNTSYLSPSEIAAELADRGRFLGLHFFSPANVMKLLEVVPVPETTADTLATGFEMARILGKVPVRSGICDGFIGNRILKRYRSSAENLLRQGAAIGEIDLAMREYGFAMGPFEAQDLGGLDIAFLNREGARARGEDVPLALADILVRAGRKGQKVNAGWYDYHPGNRTPYASTTVEQLLGGHFGPKVEWDRRSIAQGLLSDMAAEGQMILAEGVARSASDIDLVEIHGYGFPRWRGGPMFEAARKSVGDL